MASISRSPSLTPKRGTSFDPSVARAFGDVARALRVERGIAQDAFALLANVDRSYFGKLERGERQPSLALLLRIAGALEVSGKDLIELVETNLAARRPLKHA